MDPQAVVLVLLSFGLSICFGLAAWNLVKTNTHGEKIATLDAMVNGDRQENNRRFEEIKDTMKNIQNMLQALILNSKGRDD